VQKCQCGAENYEGTKFCRNCGRELSENNRKAGSKNTGIKILTIATIAIIVVSVCVIVFSLMSSNSKAEFAQDLAEAETYFDNGEYVECIKTLDLMKSNSNFKKSQEALLLEAKSHMELEEYDEAIASFKRALDIGDSSEGYANLAVCYAKKGDSDSAFEVLNNLYNRNDIRHYIQAEIYLSKNNIDKAEKEFYLAIENAHDESIKRNAYISMARMYKNERHEDKNNYHYLKKQIDIMEEAVRELQNEDDLTITEMMGEAYFTSKEYNLALIKFNRLLQLGYERDYIYRNIAIIHQQMGELSEAENVLLEMKRLYPENYQCYLQLAFVYLEMESQKENDLRDYSLVVDNYEMAKKYVDSQDENELVQLERKIEELEDGGWI